MMNLSKIRFLVLKPTEDHIGFDYLYLQVPHEGKGENAADENQLVWIFLRSYRSYHIN